jgi:1-acyl-sn-glycerol-3-phosphate acyltransferase
MYALEVAKLHALTVFGLLEIIFYTLYGFYFMWLEWRGRDGEKEAAIQRVAGVLALRALRRVHCDVHVEGRENVPIEGAVIVMANHQSQYDIPILMAHLGRMLGFVAKKELFRVPGFSYWMKLLHCISIDRSDLAGTAKVFQDLSLDIKETRSGIILFPEGTRSRDPEGALQRFKEGSLRLATLQRIPILPVTIDGSRFFSQPDRLYRTRKDGRLIRLKIAPLVKTDVQSSLERRELMAGIRNTIETNLQSIRLEWPAYSEQR